MIKNPPIIKKVVKEMGGKTKEVIPERGYFYVFLKGKKIFVSRKFSISKSFIAGREEARYKDLTHLLLEENGLPVPKTVAFYGKTTPAEIKKRLSRFKYPIIVKDAEGSQSKGIFPNISNLKTAQKVILRTIKKTPNLIVQEMVFGSEYRLLVLGGKLIAATRLIPPRVTGNGKDCVKKLIQKKQKRTREKTPFDHFLNEILKEQDCNLKSIPPKGEIIFIRKNSSLDEGGETEDVTDITHKKVVGTAVQAASSVWKDLAGIDVICDDVSKSPAEQNFHIIEINGKPDIYLHYNPTIGKTRNVVKEILEYILKLKNKR
jgi:cyanophycin synthetase